MAPTTSPASPPTASPITAATAIHAAPRTTKRMMTSRLPIPVDRRPAGRRSRPRAWRQPAARRRARGRCGARPRPSARARRGRRAGCRARPAYSSAESPGCTRNPWTPSSIRSWKPLMRLATTGRPQLIASSSTIPKDARLHGVQNTSPATRWLGRLRFRRPAQCTWGALRLARPGAGTCRSGPSPMTTRRTSPRSRCSEAERLDDRVEAVAGVEAAEEDDVLVVAQELGDGLGVG